MSEKTEPDIEPLEVPTYLETKGEDAVQIDATKLLPMPSSDAKVIAACMKRLGMKRVTDKQIADLSALGVHFNPSAMMKLAMGGAAVTEVGMLKAFTEVMRIFDASKDRAKLKIVAQVGFLGKALVTNQKMMADAARKNLPRAADPNGSPKSHRFPTLQVVFQNSSGETVVKGSEKTVIAETSLVKQG